MRTRVRRSIHCALALQPEDDFRAAVLPLFSAAEVEAVEWSFDTAWNRQPPEWLSGLVDAYASEDRLYGHGVTFSVLSARWEERQVRDVVRVIAP